MNYDQDIIPATVLHWNYRGFTEFPLLQLRGEEAEITDIYLKENLISRLPNDIGRLENLESLYLSGNDITELPREISKLRRLKCLDVSGNRLRCIPDEIGEMRSLKFLILDENELCELPLRLTELRALRYLSICDNKLQWLPQRPVYNYHHCEFRFWRNSTLKTIPYSLWYHMFRNQQTRSLNIGCLNVPKYQYQSRHYRCRLKLKKDSREWDIEVNCPSKYNVILENGVCSPPSLYELSKRKFYQTVCNAAKRLTMKAQNKFGGCPHIYNAENNYYENNNHSLLNLQNSFQGFNINKGQIDNKNKNNYAFKLIPSICKRGSPLRDNKTSREKSFYFPADVIEEHFIYLPYFIKSDLCNGPVSNCENMDCRKPIFDYVLYEFCIGKITLFHNIEDIILNAAFCSKSCADTWKKGKTNLIPWSLVQGN